MKRVLRTRHLPLIGLGLVTGDGHASIFVEAGIWLRRAQRVK
jgi:hypothetical protein